MDVFSPVYHTVGRQTADWVCQPRVSVLRVTSESELWRGHTNGLFEARESNIGDIVRDRRGTARSGDHGDHHARDDDIHLDSVPSAVHVSVADSWHFKRLADSM
jgi:hypothetical protein